MRYSSTAVEFPKEGRHRIDCNTQMRNELESSKRKEPGKLKIARGYLSKETTRSLQYDRKLNRIGKLRTPHPPPGLFGLPPAPPAGGKITLQYLARRHLFKELLYDTMGKLRTPHPPPGLFGLPPAPPTGGKITLQYREHSTTD